MPSPVNATALRQKEQRLAYVHLATGLILIAGCVTLFVWPGILGNVFEYIFIPLPKGNDPITVFQWIFTALANVLIFMAVLWLIIAAPFFAAFVILLCCIPSITGSIALLTGRSWGKKVIHYSAFTWLLIFPVGTVLSIYTFIQYKRLKT